MQYIPAYACIRGEGIRGAVRFCPQGHGVRIEAEILGLPEGFHGFHIHSGGSCEDAQGHFAPYGELHPDHAGDLPPLLSCAGRACMTVWTGRLRLRDIIGRTVVIHERRDDFTSQPSGDPGSMIACGVIRCK